MSRSHSILVTGAAGFIASNFIAACAEKNLETLAVDDAGHFMERAFLKQMRIGRILDRDTLLENIARGDDLPISAIVHLGAVTDTMEYDEKKLHKLNVEYSRTLWNYAVQRNLPFVYASSAATYGDGGRGYSDDESCLHLLEPLNPYGRSKQDFDLWVMRQEELRRVPPSWAGFKFFNVYGFGEFHKGRMASVVLHACEQIRREGSVSLFKSYRNDIPDGLQSRDFIFVEDVVNVLFFALSKPLKRGIYNVGTGRARTFLDLARAVFDALGLPERIVYTDMPPALRGKYQYFTEADPSKLRAAGYSPAFTGLEEGVKSYVSRILSYAPENAASFSGEKKGAGRLT